MLLQETPLLSVLGSEHLDVLRDHDVPPCSKTGPENSPVIANQQMRQNVGPGAKASSQNRLPDRGPAATAETLSEPAR
jgi:hypothetical protein